MDIHKLQQQQHQHQQQQQVHSKGLQKGPCTFPRTGGNNATTTFNNRLRSSSANSVLNRSGDGGTGLKDKKKKKKKSQRINININIKMNNSERVE